MQAVEMRNGFWRGVRQAVTYIGALSPSPRPFLTAQLFKSLDLLQSSSFLVFISRPIFLYLSVCELMFNGPTEEMDT